MLNKTIIRLRYVKQTDWTELTMFLSVFYIRMTGLSLIFGWNNDYKCVTFFTRQHLSYTFNTLVINEHDNKT